MNAYVHYVLNQPIIELYICDAIIKKSVKGTVEIYLGHFHWLIMNSSGYDL